MSNGTITLSASLSWAAVNWQKLLLGAVVAALVIYAYFVQPVQWSWSCYQWLINHWQTTSNYSHGPLIPLIAGGLLWLRRKELRTVRWSSDARGYFVVAAAVVLYYLGVKSVQPRVVVLSFVVLLSGLALVLGGREFHRLVFFPIVFLLLMIPLNFLDTAVGFPLRMLVAQIATAVLNWLGIHTVRVGTGIHSAVFSFDVADPCSGIRSLMALTTVTAAYAYVTQHQQWKRWVLFLSSMPLAVLGNLMRVVSIALVAQVYGQEIATKVYHDYSGYIVFAVALSAMVVVGMLLNFPYRQVLNHWLKPLQA